MFNQMHYFQFKVLPFDYAPENDLHDVSEDKVSVLPCVLLDYALQAYSDADIGPFSRWWGALPPDVEAKRGRKREGDSCGT